MHPNLVTPYNFDCSFLIPYTAIYIPPSNHLSGDFNMVENPGLDRDPPSTTNDPTRKLRDLCSTFNLRDTFRLNYGNARLFTRRQGQSQSRLDRFYVCGQVTPSSEYTTPSLSSDHDILVLETRNFEVSTHGKGRWKNNITIYDDPFFKRRFNAKWQQWCTLHPILFTSAVDWWLHMKPRIKDVNIHYARIKGNTQTKHENDLRRKVENLCQEINARPSLLPLYYQLKKEWCNMKETKYVQRPRKRESMNFKTTTKVQKTSSND